MISIHQPEHLPWLGFFNKMHLADSFVLLDSVQFKKNNWQNRNRLLTRESTDFWCTVPVVSGSSTDLIKDKLICHKPWQHKYLKRIEHEYSHSPYFSALYGRLKAIVLSNSSSLLSLNLAIIYLMREYLCITTPLVMSSELDAKGSKSALLCNITRELGSSRYLSGQSGASYIDFALFDSYSIHIDFHSYPSAQLSELNPHLHLSALHHLFWHGPHTRDLVHTN